MSKPKYEGGAFLIIQDNLDGYFFAFYPKENNPK
jgi:hypothetical protein